jgi:hypothetical protein
VRVPRALIRFDEIEMNVTGWHIDGSESNKEIEVERGEGHRTLQATVTRLTSLCMGFTTPEGAVEVNEAMDGNALIDTVTQLLRGTTQKMGNVAQPPFAANATTMFSR